MDNKATLLTWIPGSSPSMTGKDLGITKGKNCHFEFIEKSSMK